MLAPVALPSAQLDTSALCRVLAELYQAQLTLDPHNPYVREHARRRCITNQVLTFQWYQPYLPATGAILDWGCQHAPDSCLLRAAHGDRFALHACDFVPRQQYQPFYEFADLSYTQLDDVVRLPYDDGSFDVVIGSGVLEHAALDYESLKELYRIVKRDGILIISYLPNWLSLQEWRRRVICRQGFHRRLYGLGETRQLLKRSGFYPLVSGYHTFFWQRALNRIGFGSGTLAGILATLCPLTVLSSTLCFMARRVTSM